MRSSFCCVGSDGSCHDGVDFAAHVLVKNPCVCVPKYLSVFLFMNNRNEKEI